MLKKRLILVSWILISIILAVVTFGLAQWLSLSSHSLFVNFILQIILFSIFGYLIKYPFIGFSVLTVYIVTVLTIDSHFSLFNVIQLAFCFSGLFIGFLFKSKKAVVAMIVLIITSVGLIIIKQTYLSRVNEKTNIHLSIQLLNENKQFLSDHQHKQPSFSLDTVYLVNFGFLYCYPCRLKKKALREIALQFKNKAFKIVEIHSEESREIFDSLFFISYTNPYHDSINKLSKTMNVSSYPTEFIFNKNGESVRKLEGINPDNLPKYQESTIALINRLLNEK